MKKILFHHPLPLNPKSKSASGIRPIRILQAFKDLGYQVDLVTGYANERKHAIKQIKNNIRKGIKYDFMYAESSTMPTTLTEQHHLPTHPFMDWFFFRFCKKNNIPIGLFYRDIYWLFDNYGNDLNLIKKIFAKLAYKFDLKIYEKTTTKLYLPSIEMAQYVPNIGTNKFAALPPGHISPSTEPKSIRFPLKLFYVGGMSSHYQMHKLFSALNNMSNVQFTLCTRKEEWESVKEEYPDPAPNIRIIHKSGLDMEQELAEADIALLFVLPQEYRSFAAPVKLYEYLGKQKPIIASKGTLAAKFVTENNIGWSIEYTEEALINLLNNLIKQPEALDDIKTSIKKVTPMHSWHARAKQVVRELTQ